ncbi:MAG: AAA family ATPase [Gallionella sp.]|nr:AAA family ATPase [Gallionella sp.]
MTTEQHIILEGLTGVGRVELALRPDQRVYALIGSNGVGKTKCLEALFLWLFFSNQLVNKVCLSSSSDDIVNSTNLIGKILVDGALVYESVPATLRHNQRFISDAVPEGVNMHQKPVVFLGAKARATIETIGNAVLPTLGLFEDRRKRYWDEVIAAINDSKMASLGMDTNTTQWFVLRAQSANRYQRGGDNRAVEIDTLLKLLNQVDERIDPAFLEIDGANQVAIKVSGVLTQLQHLSSGFTALLKMLQAIVAGFANFTNEVNLTHVSGMVLIDEIESHLHTEWQSKIIPLLKQLFPNTTFFVATHSPIVLSQLQEGEAYRLEKQADGVVRSMMIKAPNKRILDDVLDDAMGVNLNALKRVRLEQDDQTELKQKLQNLLDRARSKT